MHSLQGRFDARLFGLGRRGFGVALSAEFVGFGHVLILVRRVLVVGWWRREVSVPSWPPCGRTIPSVVFARGQVSFGSEKTILRLPENFPRSPQAGLECDPPPACRGGLAGVGPKKTGRSAQATAASGAASAVAPLRWSLSPRSAKTVCMASSYGVSPAGSCGSPTAAGGPPGGCSVQGVQRPSRAFRGQGPVLAFPTWGKS